MQATRNDVANRTRRLGAGLVARLAALTAGLTLLLAFQACGGSNDYTLDNVCDKFPEQWCAILEPCCEAWFDRAECVAEKRRECQLHVEHTRAENLNFNPERIDACLAGEQDLFSQCVVSTLDIQHELHDMRDCFDIFTGNRPPGTPCDFDDECLMPPNGFAICSAHDNNLCKQWILAQPGQACDSTGPYVIVFCDEGLYCDRSAGAGVCQPQLPVGAPCDPTGVTGRQCGQYAYCDPLAVSCAPRKLGGEPCASAMSGGIGGGNVRECLSRDCDPSTNLCTPPEDIILASERVCHGSGTPLDSHIQ
ncbi:MAG: hypothetical protein MJD61_03965 [Proteobacteria bacterium]|nr:hypothetical protein [Pseudomonadota bacterium]